MTFYKPLQHICYAIGDMSAIKIRDMMIWMFQAFCVFEGIFFIHGDKSTFCEQDLSQMDIKILVNLHSIANYFFLK